MVRKISKWTSSYGTIDVDGEEIGEEFDNKEDAKRFDNDIKSIITGVKFFHGRKRIKCRTTDDVYDAIDSASKIVFVSMSVKRTYMNLFGFYACDPSGLPERWLTSSLVYRWKETSDDIHFQADDKDDDEYFPDEK